MHTNMHAAGTCSRRVDTPACVRVCTCVAACTSTRSPFLPPYLKSVCCPSFPPSSGLLCGLWPGVTQQPTKPHSSVFCKQGFVCVCVCGHRSMDKQFVSMEFCVWVFKSNVTAPPPLTCPLPLSLLQMGQVVCVQRFTLIP